MSIARSIRERLDGRYVLQGHMLDRSLPFITAASIRPGMVMAIDSGQFDVVERIERETHDAEVYDLNVERTHNFIAGGIVTHNSIYRWRGARVENLHQFRRDFPQAQLVQARAELSLHRHHLEGRQCADREQLRPPGQDICGPAVPTASGSSCTPRSTSATRRTSS